MTPWEIRCAALEQVKSAIAEFCKQHPEQDFAAMIAMADATLSVEPIQEVREKMASVAKLCDDAMPEE